MARESSSFWKTLLERFNAAASYVGFDGSSNSVALSSEFPDDVSSNPSAVISKLPYDVAFFLYASYQQATVGPCNIPKPSSCSPVEQCKWRSWKQLRNMLSSEAMVLFVTLLEEEDPGWYSRVSNFVPEPIADVEINLNLESDQWIAPPVSGPCPRARYEHGAAVIDDKMYVFGGYCNGRYLSDLQTLDLKTWTWSKVEVRAGSEASPTSVTPCVGHSLIAWEGNKLLSIGGHTKDPSESMEVKVFDLRTSCWSTLKTYGKPPVSRGGHSATLVGSSLVIFGGEDAKRSLLNDLHILDLEAMTWDEIDTLGVAPSPRFEHTAAEHAERYVLIFGGGSHATSFNDLHVLDLQTREWSRPAQQGEIPSTRDGHAGVAVGDKWFIVGGGDNWNGVSQTIVLNMSTLVWSVVTTVQGCVPLASKGLSLVLSSYNGEDILVSFAGYNGVSVLKPSHKSTLQSKIMETQVPDSVSTVHNTTNAIRDIESEFETGQEGKTRETIIDFKPVVNKAEEMDEIEVSLCEERLQPLQLKQELADAETRNAELYKELQSVRDQLGAEQSRRVHLEVVNAELQQKLETMEAAAAALEKN